ncbi:MAG: regulatory protein RecX [Pyrinomonadaceae bacterium]
MIDPERARSRTFARAAKLLAAKPRSVAELRERLLDKEWTDEPTVELVLERLTEYGYLDDKRFAAGHAAMQLRMKPVGRVVVLRALAQKQVDRAIAEEAAETVFSEMPEEQLIKQAIAKRIRLRGKPTNRAETKSLYDHLIRRGFHFDLVIDSVKGLAEFEDE